MPKNPKVYNVSLTSLIPEKWLCERGIKHPHDNGEILRQKWVVENHRLAEALQELGSTHSQPMQSRELSWTLTAPIAKVQTYNQTLVTQNI